VFLDELLKFRADESLLLFLDEREDPRVAAAIELRAVARGGRTERLCLNSRLPLAAQAEQVAARIRSGSFNAVCELASDYFYLTAAWAAARESGARIYCLGGLDAPSFIRCVGQVDHRRMFAFGLAVKEILGKSTTITISSPGGTNLRMRRTPQRGGLVRWTGRIGRRLRRSVREVTRRLGLKQATAFLRAPDPQDFLFDPAGYIDDGGSFLGGQLSFRGIPSTIEGTAVIDGYLWPTGEIAAGEEPVILRFEHGAVTAIEGCKLKSAGLRGRLNGHRADLEHFCLGLNPGAGWGGKLLEAERVFGAITVGFGKGFRHTDGIIRDPTLLADDTVILENRSFQPALFGVSGDKLRHSPRGAWNSTAAG
jgi:leucyl aminopeptidase (aminopeptidase T)